MRLRKNFGPAGFGAFRNVRTLAPWPPKAVLLAVVVGVPRAPSRLDVFLNMFKALKLHQKGLDSDCGLNTRLWHCMAEVRCRTRSERRPTASLAGI